MDSPRELQNNSCAILRIALLCFVQRSCSQSLSIIFTRSSLNSTKCSEPDSATPCSYLARRLRGLRLSTPTESHKTIVAQYFVLHSFVLCSREELNPHLVGRNHLFYPLNYESNVLDNIVLVL